MLRFLAVVALCACVLVPTQIFAADLHLLTVLSYPDRPAKLPLWLARDAGLFEKYGLKVDIKTPKSGGEDIVAGIGRDEAQIYAATANWIVSGIGDGKDLVFFANTGYSVLKLLSKPSITRPSELKGKRVGTGEANSSQDRITRQALQRIGLDPDKDVTLVPMGQRSLTRLNALVKGEIDATTSNEDNIFDLERRGESGKVRVLADNESLKLFIGGGVDFAVTRNLLVNSRPLVKGFVQALCEAVALARRERAQADRIYMRYLNVKDPALLEFMYRTYVHGAIPERPFPRLENVALGIEEFAAKPGLKGKRAEDITDPGLVKELENEAFFNRLYRQSPEHGKYGE
ncbi:MAG TPA: ABC transporter substrate-binding protein [Candidatus Saccharimonadales bacterium]|nr:ABC transporter substrate-binding protein [Candidatus Saccharimonadales bacterium]